MRADYTVVLDACVLIPMPLADTLLRMAETPRLYLPKWSQTIMDEVTTAATRRILHSALKPPAFSSRLS